MTLSYTNRNQEVFYFKVAKTKKGNCRYYVTKKIMEDCINVLPEGFEIYEHPEEATVVLRLKPQLCKKRCACPKKCPPSVAGLKMAFKTTNY